MKQIKKLLLIFLLTLWISTTNWYVFGIKSADNTITNIVEIQNKYNFDFKIVWFIFDPRSEDVLWTMNNLNTFLWTWKIYHITLSPNSYSAKQVAEWIFDEQYRQFFQTMKENDLKVIFRTMHEMNWGRYPRWSNPDEFKQARIHVRELSRDMWLDQNNILFDFSVNHRDMPTKGKPSQSASLIKCPVWKKWCYHFEDYYPWDEYVDVVWFTFYNRWKAVDNRMWLSPREILYDTNRKTYPRLQALNKPIIIDEVATTSVWYNWAYQYSKSRNEYLTENDRKDYWLHQLWEFLVEHPEIVATIYFNCDYTHWLQFVVQWEADWSIVNLDDNKVYNGFWDLELFWEKDLNNILASLFHLKKLTIEWNDIIIPQKCSNDFIKIWSVVNEKTENAKKIELINKLHKRKFKSECVLQALDIFSEIYWG